MKIVLCLILFIICLIIITTKDAIYMPMSWNDATGDYKKCFHCEEYLSKGGHESCKNCPFYCEPD